ncbi:Formate dehydrogenase N, transmembrane [compost metagenome]
MGAAVLAGFFHYVRIGPNRVEEDEHPRAPDTSVHVVDPTVHVFDPNKPGAQGEERP